MRSIKVFGLVLVAALAMSAVVASAASAFYDSEVETTTLSGKQGVENEFTTDVGTVKCKTATFSGTQKGAKVEGGFTAEMINVTPTYSECNLAGQAVSVTTTGCEYTFDPLETLETADKTKHIISKATVLCETGKEIIIKDKAGLGCEVKVKAQMTGGRVKLTNAGAGKTRTVLVTAEVTGISYSWTAGCPNAAKKAGSNTNGTYSGTVSTEGKNAAKEQVGIWVTTP
jgi:hypothetical protein